MRTRQVFFVIGILVCFCLASLQAQPAEQRAVQYSIKFVCGWLPPVPPQDDQFLKPGDYATAINIHNPNTSGVVRGAKRVALHYRMGTTPPPVITNFAFTVANRRVLEIDCQDIWFMAGVPSGTFLKGMVHVGLDEELPIAAVYTSQTHNNDLTGPDPGAGHSIDVEYVKPFRGVPVP